jgi:hypothetical protein
MLAAPVLLAIPGAVRCLSAPQDQSSPPADLQQDLQKIAHLAPDVCPDGIGEDASDIYNRFFPHAAENVVAELNAPSAALRPPRERATDALQRLEQLSAAVNSAWPEDARFHFEVLDLTPAIVVKMSIRTSETYYVFAVPTGDAGKPNAQWSQYESEEDVGRNAANTSLDLYPLHRGPSGRPRFLADFTFSGCMGSFGTAYEAREWNPDSATLTKIISQDGAWGLVVDDPLEGIGKLQTEGPVITLPYCWFSPIDTWDNPTLCAVDTYDLSGDDARFEGHAYNRPDLVPVAKAIEYAQKRDSPALLGYCASSEVADSLVRDMPPDIFAIEIKVTPEGTGKERVELDNDSVYTFEVEKVGDRWLVVSFSPE